MTESPQAPPITRLPPELLQDIFIRCSHADENDEGYNTPDVEKAPFLLSHVRRSWRQLAFHMPKLWCRLRLDWTTRKRWFPSLIGKLWLSRCGSIPIHLSIRERQDGYFQYENSGTLFALEYASRLSSLSLTYDTPFHTEGLSLEDELKIQNLRFPLLQHLELRGFSFDSIASLVDSVRCPQLSKYILDQFPFSWDFDESLRGIKTLSGSITHLDLHENSRNEDELAMFANILPLLSTFNITVELEPHTQDDSQLQRKLIFPNLRRIGLSFTNGADLISDDGNSIILSLTFSRLFTPNLIALETDYAGQSIPHDNYYVANAVYEFVQRSQCSLQELTVSGWGYDVSLNGTRILELASSIPTLRMLSYEGLLDCYGYCSRVTSVHHLHKPVDDHPLIRMKDGGWEFLPLLEDLMCIVDGDAEGAVLPEVINAIDKRMRSRSNALKRCRAVVVTRRLSGISEIVSAALDSLEELGLWYGVVNAALQGDVTPSSDMPQNQ